VDYQLFQELLPTCNAWEPLLSLFSGGSIIAPNVI